MSTEITTSPFSNGGMIESEEELPSNDDRETDFDTELVKQGITDNVEANKYREVLSATKVIKINKKTYEGGKLATWDEETMEVPDYTIQIQALKMLSTMRGRFEQKKKTLDARRVMDRIFVINGKPLSNHSQEALALPQTNIGASTHDTSLSIQEEEEVNDKDTVSSPVSWTA